MSFDPEPDARVRLRPATRDDAGRLLEWRNAPEARAASRNTGKIGRDEHLAWLADVLASSERTLSIIEADGAPVGQVRLDRLRDGLFELSVSVELGRSGAGLGRRAIAIAVESLRALDREATVVADVRADNTASLRAFEAAGFERAGDADEPGFLRLRSVPG